MFHRLDPILAAFDPARGGPRLAGFAFGMVLPLVLAAVAFAAFNGGLSDTPRAADPVYIIE